MILSYLVIKITIINIIFPLIINYLLDYPIMNNNPFSPNDKEIQNVHALGPYQKYHYFVGKVADWEQVWTVSDGQNFVTLRDQENGIAVALWPAKAYVELCLVHQWAHFTPMQLTLEQLMTELLPDMHEANIKAAIMMKPNGANAPYYDAYDASMLLADLAEECQQYE